MPVARSGLMLGAVVLGCLVLAATEASAFCGYRGCGSCRTPCYSYGNVDWTAPYYLGWNGYCVPGAVPFPAYFPPCYRPPDDTYSEPPTVSPPKATPLTTSASAAGVLYVNVPATARVFINGLLTKTTGETRRYTLPGLIAGATYKYQIRVELPGAEQPLTETVILSAGDERQLSFDPSIAATGIANVPLKPRTSVTSRAPAGVR